MTIRQYFVHGKCYSRTDTRNYSEHSFILSVPSTFKKDNNAIFDKAIERIIETSDFSHGANSKVTIVTLNKL